MKSDKQGNIILLAVLLMPIVFYGIKTSRVLSNISKQTLRRDNVSEDIASDCAYECAKAYDIMYTWEEQQEKMYKIADNILNTRVLASHGSTLISTDANGIRTNKNDPQLVLRYDISYGKTGIIHCTINASASQKVQTLQGGVENIGKEGYITKTYRISSTGSATPAIYYQNLDIVGCIPSNAEAHTLSNTLDDDSNADTKTIGATCTDAFKSIVDKLHYKFSQASIIPYNGRITPDATFLPQWTTPHVPLIWNEAKYSLSQSSDSNVDEKDTAAQLRKLHEVPYFPISAVYHMGFTSSPSDSAIFEISNRTTPPQYNTVSMLVGEKHTDMLSNDELTSQGAKMYALQDYYPWPLSISLLRRKYTTRIPQNKASYAMYHLSPEREDTFSPAGTKRQDLLCVQECKNLSSLFQQHEDDEKYTLSNQSNFNWLAAHWAYNMLNKTWAHSMQSLVRASNTDSDSHISMKNRKKVAIIFVNQDDKFRPHECTYLGFSNDYAQIPAHESSVEDFEEGNYSGPWQSHNNPHRGKYSGCRISQKRCPQSTSPAKYDTQNTERIFLDSQNAWGSAPGTYTISDVQGKYVELEIEPSSLQEQIKSTVNVINPSWIMFNDFYGCDIRTVQMNDSSNPRASFSARDTYRMGTRLDMTSLDTKYHTFYFPKSSFQYNNTPLKPSRNFGEYKLSFQAKNCAIVDAYLVNQTTTFTLNNEYHQLRYKNMRYSYLGDAGISMTPPHTPVSGTSLGQLWYMNDACPGDNGESVRAGQCSCCSDTYHYYQCANEYFSRRNTCPPGRKGSISSTMFDDNASVRCLLFSDINNYNSYTRYHSSKCLDFSRSDQYQIYAIQLEALNPTGFALTGRSYSNNSVSLKRNGDTYYVCFPGSGDLYITVRNNSNNTNVSTEEECHPYFYEHTSQRSDYPTISGTNMQYDRCKTLCLRSMDTNQYNNMQHAYNCGLFSTDAAFGWDSHLRINRGGSGSVSSPIFNETTVKFYWTFWRTTVPRYTYFNGRRITEYAAHSGSIVSQSTWPRRCYFENWHTWMADWQNWSSYIYRIECQGIYWHDLGATLDAPKPSWASHQQVTHHFWRNSIRRVTPCSYQIIPTTKTVITPAKSPSVVTVQGINRQGQVNNGLYPGVGTRTIQGRTKLYFTAEEVTGKNIILELSNARLIRARVSNFAKRFPTEYTTPGQFSITQLSGIADIERCYHNAELVPLNKTISITRPTTLLLIPKNLTLDYPEFSNPDAVVRFNAQNTKINEAAFSSPVYKLTDQEYFTCYKGESLNGMFWQFFRIQSNLYRKFCDASHPTSPIFAIQCAPNDRSVFISVASPPTEGLQFPGSFPLASANFSLYDRFSTLSSAKVHLLEDATLYNGNTACDNLSAYCKGQPGDMLARSYPFSRHPVWEAPPYRYIYISLEPSYGHTVANGKYNGGLTYLRQPTDLSYDIRGCEVLRFGSLSHNVKYPTSLIVKTNLTYDEIYGHHVANINDNYTLSTLDESKITPLKMQDIGILYDYICANGRLLYTITGYDVLRDNTIPFQHHSQSTKKYIARLHSIAITKQINKALLRCGYQSEDETATDGIKKLSKAAFKKLCDDKEITVYIVIYNKNNAVSDLEQFTSLNARKVFTVAQVSELNNVMEEIMDDINTNICPKKIYQYPERISRQRLR